jgi:hypothetical protein
MAHGARVPRDDRIGETCVIDFHVARVAHAPARDEDIADGVASVRALVTSTTRRTDDGRKMAFVAEHERNSLRRKHDGTRSGIGIVGAGRQPGVGHGTPARQRAETGSYTGGFRYGGGRGKENRADEQYREGWRGASYRQTGIAHLKAPSSP